MNKLPATGELNRLVTIHRETKVKDTNHDLVTARVELGRAYAKRSKERAGEQEDGAMLYDENTVTYTVRWTPAMAGIDTNCELTEGDVIYKVTGVEQSEGAINRFLDIKCRRDV